jgi:transposase
MAKLKQKISGCFRSEDGGEWFTRVRSYLSSAKKQGLNAFEALLMAVQNYNHKPLLGAK